MSRLIVCERIVVDAGYRQAYTPVRDETSPQPSLEKYHPGQRVKPRAHVRQKKGLAEGELIAQMQNRGVGRPSTYATTLEALRRHGYIEERDGRLIVTTRGEQALDFLRENYPFLLDADFTALLEGQLDAIAKGRTTYKNAVQFVWDRLQKQTNKDGKQ
jgi:DNA topoisomerase-1